MAADAPAHEWEVVELQVLQKTPDPPPPDVPAALGRAVSQVASLVSDRCCRCRAGVPEPLQVHPLELLHGQGQPSVIIQALTWRFRISLYT